MGIPTFRQDARTGGVHVDPRMLNVQPYHLTPDYPNNVLTIAANAIGSPQIFTGPQEGAFEGRMIALWATDIAQLLVFRMVHRKRKLQNASIHARTIWGGAIPTIAGASMFYLPESLWLKPQETFELEFQDYSGQNNIVKPVIHGILYSQGVTPEGALIAGQAAQRADEQNERSLPFFYTNDAPPISLANTNITPFAVRIAPDGGFVMTKISAVSTGAFLLKYFDPNTGRALTSQPVHSDLITGNAWFPFVLPHPLYMRPNSVFNFELTDLTGTTNTIYLTFAGYRVYQGNV